MGRAALILALVAGCVACGCGQKGALYLPGDRESVTPAPASASPDAAPVPATSTPPASVPVPPPAAATPADEERDENAARNRGR